MILLRCPECGRLQKVSHETYLLSLTGHPLTCNGGNPADYEYHHDHEVIMEVVCYEN